MLKRISITVVLSALAFLSAGGACATEAAPKKWTFMVYMCADNDLDARGPEDVAELEAAGSSENVNILVQLDRANAPARRYYITKRAPGAAVDDWGSASRLEAELGEIDSGDPDRLVDFFKWSAAQYPAERYALVIWNHGSGWKSPARAAGATDHGKRGIAYDFDSKNDISTPELGRAVDAMRAAAGRRIDLLIMDACLMQMLEIVYEVKDGVNFVCASEDIEPDSGMPYLPVCELLNARPQISAKDLAIAVAGAFAEKFEAAGTPYTYSAVDCSRVEALAEALDGFCAAAIERAELVRGLMKKSSDETRRFTYEDYADLGDFITLVSEAPGAREVNGASGEDLASACARVKAACIKCVAANRTGGEAVSKAKGLAVYLPRKYIKKAYSELKFTKRSLWDEMLRETLELKEGW